MKSITFSFDAREAIEAAGLDIRYDSCGFLTIEDAEFAPLLAKIDGIVSPDDYKVFDEEFEELWDLAITLNSYAESHPEAGFPEEARQIIRDHGWVDLSEVEDTDPDQIAYDPVRDETCYYNPVEAIVVPGIWGCEDNIIDYLKENNIPYNPQIRY